jgi:hypothetical protein
LVRVCCWSFSARAASSPLRAALGADDDLAYLVTRVRRAWPDVVLHFRGDCAFGVPAMYEVCEGLRVSYTFGLSANAVLQLETEGLLAEAISAYVPERQEARQHDPPRTAVPSRLFTGFWYQAGTWPCARFVVAKAEANDRETNPALRGDQPALRRTPAGADLRRVRRPRGE